MLCMASLADASDWCLSRGSVPMTSAGLTETVNITEISWPSVTGGIRRGKSLRIVAIHPSLAASTVGARLRVPTIVTVVCEMAARSVETEMRKNRVLRTS